MPVKHLVSSLARRVCVGQAKMLRCFAWHGEVCGERRYQETLYPRTLRPGEWAGRVTLWTRSQGDMAEFLAAHLPPMGHGHLSMTGWVGWSEAPNLVKPIEAACHGEAPNLVEPIEADCHAERVNDASGLTTQCQ